MKVLVLLLMACFSEVALATTGIDSVGTLWVVGLVLLGLIVLLVAVVKFLLKFKQDTQDHDQSNDM